ncbi:MAG: methyltransferase domain-containing protein [Candidatus Dadabacteria bacterium]|nr:methyltransferase domain-containing protein [Candidatus Dadabacteria bacterium]
MIRNELIRTLKYVDRNSYILDICDSKNVLHLGCTDFPFHQEQFESGNLLHRRLINKCKNLYGVDISEEAIDWCRENVGGGEYFLYDIESKEFPGKLQSLDVDIILLPDVIEHLNNPGLALANIRALCVKNGCKLIITAPNAYSIKSYFRVVIGYEYIHQDHVAFYSIYTLYNLLKRFEFDCEDFFAFPGGGKAYPSLLINLFLKWVPRLAEGIGIAATIR